MQKSTFSYISYIALAAPHGSSQWKCRRIVYGLGLQGVCPRSALRSRPKECPKECAQGVPEGLFSAWGAGPFAAYSRKKNSDHNYGARSWGALWGACLGRGLGRVLWLGARDGARSWGAAWGALLGHDMGRSLRAKRYTTDCIQDSRISRMTVCPSSWGPVGEGANLLSCGCCGLQCCCYC